jgi:copper chaperone
MQHSIIVENIKCAGCMNSIKKALLDLEGIEQVSIDKTTETVNVEGRALREEIVHKLAQLGYPERGNNSLLHKAKSFVSCAVGRISEEVAL